MTDTVERLRGEVTAMKRYRFDEAEKADAREAALRERIKVLETQMERQKDEWLSWSEKRKGLEQDAERLRNLLAADVHSCHPGCTRAGCVNERLRLELTGVIQIMATHANQLQNYAGNLEVMLERKG